MSFPPAQPSTPRLPGPRLPGPAPATAAAQQQRPAVQQQQPAFQPPVRPPYRRGLPPSAWAALPAQAPPSREEAAALAAAEDARKRRRDLRNINITLYAACLLLVAAAALFIGLAIPATARFAGVTAVAGLFYAGGLAVHARSRRLRPAAVAFTGTGLALIPVVGLALHNFVLSDAPLAWLATSLAGTAAFAYAAAKLDSRVVAYLSITFLLSTALASGASMRSGIIWYFLFTVVLATALSLAALRRPHWVSNIYLDAFVRSHRFLVPAAAAAALLMAGEMGGWQFSFLFLAFAAYYAVVFLPARGAERLVNSYGFRITATVGLAALIYKVTDNDGGMLVLAASLAIAVQVAGLLAWRARYDALGGRPYFTADISVLLSLQALAGVAAGLYATLPFIGAASGTGVFTATAVLVLLTFMAAAWRVAAVPSAAPAGAALLGFMPRVADPRDGSLWPAALLGALLTAYFVVRAVRSAGVPRHGFVLAARTAATGLVPVLAVAVCEAAGTGPAETVRWALLLSAAAVLANQLVSLYLLAAGRPARFAEASLGAAAGLAALLTLSLRFTEAPGSVLPLWVLFASLAVNVFTTLVSRRVPAVVVWLEWMAPAGFVVAAGLGAGLLGVRGYEVLAGAALAYSGFMAVRGARPGLRGVYLLAAQLLLAALAALITADLDPSVHGVFTAIAVSMTVQLVLRTLLQDKFADVGMNQLVSVAQWGSIGVLTLLPLLYAQVAARPLAGLQTALLATAAGAAVFLQVSMVFRRAGSRPVPVADASLVAAACLVPLVTVVLRFTEDPGTVLTLWVLFAGLGANVLMTLVPPRAGADRSTLEWAGAAGFAVASVVGAGLLGVRGYEVLTVAALVYCGFMALRRARAGLRGLYGLAIQALLATLTALVAADLDLGVHGGFVAVAVCVAVTQVLRSLLQDRFDVVGRGPWAAAAQWGSVAVLVLLPFAYAVTAHAGVQRHVVAVSLVLLPALSLAAFRRTRDGRELYPAVYALGLLPVVLTSVFGFSDAGPLGGGPTGAPLSLTAASSILLAMAAAGLATETRAAGTGVRNPLLIGAGLACVLVLPLAGLAGNQLLAGLAVLLPAAGFLIVSFTRRQPWLAAVTVAAVPAAAFLIHAWLIDDVLVIRPQPGAAQLWPGFAAAVLLYCARYAMSVLPASPPTVLRGRILGSGASFLAAAAAVAAMASGNATAVYGSVVLIAALAAAVREFPRAWRESAGEAAALVAALAVERIIWHFADGLGWFWSLQYWVVVLAALAAYEFRRNRSLRGTAVLCVSATVLTGSGLSSIVSADAGEQVWALLGHAGLLAFGLLTNRRLFTVWGAAGVVLAVLWYLRGYTFLLLALLAAALIALAVWRLTRVRVEAADDRVL